MLIRDGELDEKNLRRCGLTHSDIEAALRQHGYTSVDDVPLAIFEAKGSVSVLHSSALRSEELEH